MDIKEKIKSLPQRPGVYLMKDRKARVVYVGKAADLKKRVSSYFQKTPAAVRNAMLIEQICDIETIETASEHEAFLLESRLIKRFRPRFNVSLRDDKSFPFIKISKEPYPRVFIGRRKPHEDVEYFGPYTNVGVLRAAIQSLRKTFPFCSCRRFLKTACLDYHLGLCSAPCAGTISKQRYRKIILDFKHFLQKGSMGLRKKLEKRMRYCSEHRHYEEALQLRERIRALGVLAEQSTSGLFELLGLFKEPHRIEAFDISTLLGKEAVGSMVTFIVGKPSKANYRRFKIKSVEGIDDYKMIQELVHRRYRRVMLEALEKPDLIVIDGGRGHLHAALHALHQEGLDIPMIAIAKEKELIYTIKHTQPIALSSGDQALQLIQRVRDEAHRFALAYHHLLRKKQLPS